MNKKPLGYVIPKYLSAKEQVAQWISYVGAKFNTKDLWMVGFDIDSTTDSLGQTVYNEKIKPSYVSKIVSWDMNEGVAITDDGAVFTTDSPIPNIDEKDQEQYLRYI